MKKILLIGGIVVLLFMIIASYSCNAKADEIQPSFSGDIFLNKELYLFNQYTTTPNYENGYRAKKTITYNDIYSGDNEIYNTWYFQLGHDIVDTPENEPYFDTLEWWLYIPLDLTLAQYVQLAIIADTTKSQEFYIYLSDGSYFYRDSNQELYNQFLFTLPQSKNNIGVEFIAWSVSPPDYYASFHPLTSELAYQFGYHTGYTWGYRDGHDTGYNTGYNSGYNTGYNMGLNGASQPGYVSIQNYNQLINRRETITINGVTFTKNNDGSIGLSGTATATIYYNLSNINFDVIEGHKYLILVNNINDTENILWYNDSPYWQGTTSQIVVASTSVNNQVLKLRIRNGAEVDEKLVFNQIDLTLMFGDGNEPTMEICENIFSSSIYYPFSLGEPVNINYLDGYTKGKQEGVQEGINIGETHTISISGWFMSLFDMFSSFLSIQILPGVTIGLIVGVPFIISLAWFVIRMYRGGGGA